MTLPGAGTSLPPMRALAWSPLAPLLLALVALAGCSASAPSDAPPAPPAPPPSASEQTIGDTRYVSGSADSVGSIPGSAGALYYYRFRQIEPGSDRFVYQDRDLSFHFRPTPDVLFFQIENRTDRPVWIDWDRCVFYDPVGNTGKTAHGSTVWRDRYSAQAPTQILGLQRFGDFVYPMDYLLDPGGGDQQLHRALLPEDESATQYSGRDFGVDLVMRVAEQPRTYTFRFRVVSVIPTR